MRFSLSLTFAFLCISPLSFAPQIEILIRPSLSTVYGNILFGTTLPSFKKDPLEAAGHVAIRLPPGRFGLGATVYGWSPQLEGYYLPGEPAAQLTRDERLDYISNYDVNAKKWKTIPGQFENNELWALSGVNHPSLATMAIPIEVTEAQLQTLLQNMRKLQLGHARYQFSPMKSQSYDANSFNCATAMLEAFKGTGVDLSFFPERGSMPGFYRAALKEGQARPWEPCAIHARALNPQH